MRRSLGRRAAGLDSVGHADADGPGTFGPMDVMSIIKATADHDADGHTVANAGPGYVNAEAAVDRAARGKFASPSKAHDNPVDDSDDGKMDDPLTVGDGSRSDDGQVFTGGATNHVQVTVENPSEAVTVYDEIPAPWNVISEESTADIEGEGRQRVELGTVPAGTTRTFGYFVKAPEAPGATSGYTFGPTTAEATSASTEVAGTETNYVVGVSTQAPF